MKRPIETLPEQPGSDAFLLRMKYEDEADAQRAIVTAMEKIFSGDISRKTRMDLAVLIKTTLFTELPRSQDSSIVILNIITTCENLANDSSELIDIIVHTLYVRRDMVRAMQASNAASAE